MKGLVVAGGRGTRLYPLTRAVSKQLLPIHDKPMIYYPISVLMLLGARDIMVVTTPDDLPRYQALLGDGDQWGVRLRFLAQLEPEGVAHAVAIAGDFIEGQNVAVVLGDNLLHGKRLAPLLREAAARQERTGGATIFTYPVSNPEQFGVAQLGRNGKVLALQEKPERSTSDQAVIGLYLYDGDASPIAKGLERSTRGEYEITDLNRHYLERDRLRVRRLGRGVKWLDTGTPAALLEASSFIASIERRQGTKVACLEEIALQQGFISRDEFEKVAAELPGGSYAAYLRQLARDLPHLKG